MTRPASRGLSDQDQWNERIRKMDAAVTAAEIIAGLGAIGAGFGGWRFCVFILGKVKDVEKDVAKTKIAIEKDIASVKLEQAHYQRIVASDISEIKAILQTGKEARQGQATVLGKLYDEFSTLRVDVGKIQQHITNGK